MKLLAWLTPAALAAVLVACAPRSVAEAEEKGDARWLEQNGSREAILALGRLADKDAAPLAIIEARSRSEPLYYRAAWEAVERGSAWGPSFFRQALADPARAETAAGEIDRKSAKVADFVTELDQALVRLSSTPNNAQIAAALASAGPAAHDLVTARLQDGATRPGMCRGIAADESAADARTIFMTLPATARDHAVCVESAIKLAKKDPEALKWLGARAEPGIIGAAAKADGLPCATLAEAWRSALPARSKEAHAFEAALGQALKRCAPELDLVLAEALKRAETHPLVVLSIDAYEPYCKHLRDTCKALPDGPNEAPAVRERVADARKNGCRF